MPNKENSFEAALTWLKMRCRPTAALSHKKVGGGTNSVHRNPHSRSFLPQWILCLFLCILETGEELNPAEPVNHFCRMSPMGSKVSCLRIGVSKLLSIFLCPWCLYQNSRGKIILQLTSWYISLRKFPQDSPVGVLAIISIANFIFPIEFA